MAEAATPAGRREQLEGALVAVQERIERACTAAGRCREDVHLVVVTKFFPASDIALLAGLGVTDVGESRDQEAAAKVAELRCAAAGDAGADGATVPRVHFVGQLQSRKAGSVARYADVVHSVDREKVARALDHGAQAAGRTLDVLVQVSLDADPDRGGVPAARAGELADVVAGMGHLRLRGVMAVAPLGADPDRAFADLATVAAGIRERHPGATWVSAGMSGDLEAAIAHGATHLRVGSAILGSRPAHR
ncbi:YggS family pyridoxal phosphate-dependent enzyme [Oryzihumus sp.]